MRARRRQKRREPRGPTRAGHGEIREECSSWNNPPRALVANLGRCSAATARRAMATLLTLLLLVAGAPMLTRAQRAPGPASCTTHDDFEHLVENVATNCCDQFDQQDNCDNGLTVRVCDTRCAPVFIEFWAACSEYIQTSLPSPAIRQQFTSTQSKCHATLQANEVHDTDLVKPGDQVDMTTPLHAQQLGWKDSKELLVGDTPEAYAAQCIKLYQDEKLWQDVRDAGLAAIVEDCSQETFRKNLAGLFS